MSSENIYCVYHITYLGDKLPHKNTPKIIPSNYIGSTSLKQIESGYIGSVSSKKYSVIWKQELKEHPELFHLEIISYHDTRSEAAYKELQIQKLFNVVKNPLFVNMAYANINGCHGMDVSDKNNPNYGNGHKIIGEKNIRFGIHDDYETYKKISESNSDKIRCKDSSGKTIIFTKEEYKLQSILKSNRYNKTTVINIHTKEKKDVSSEEFKSLNAKNCIEWISPICKYLYYTPYGVYTNLSCDCLKTKGNVRNWCNNPDVILKPNMVHVIKNNETRGFMMSKIGLSFREIGFWKEEIIW